MAAKKKGVDLAIVFGGPAKGKGGVKPPESAAEDAAEVDEESPSPEFEAAFDEYQANPADAMAFWRAVKACVEGGY